MNEYRISRAHVVVTMVLRPVISRTIVSYLGRNFGIDKARFFPPALRAVPATSEPQRKSESA